MDKIDQQIIESIISVVNPDTTERDQLVIEYIEGYFGGELNESTTDDDIIEAFAKLLETADAVEEFMIQEGGARDARVTAALERGARTGVQAAAKLRRTGVVTGRQAADIAFQSRRGAVLHPDKISNIETRASNAANRRAKFITRVGADPNLTTAQKTTMIGRAQGHTARAAKTTARLRPGQTPGRLGIRIPGEQAALDKARTRAHRSSGRGSGSDQLRTKRPALTVKPKPKPKPVISPKAPVKQGLGARIMARLRGGG